MNGIEEISFKMIAAIGEAKTLIMEAINSASEQEYLQAKEKLALANDKFSEAHQAHFSLIQQEANGEKVELGILIVHAEDQLMTTSLLRDVAEQLIKLYQKLYELTKK